MALCKCVSDVLYLFNGRVAGGYEVGELFELVGIELEKNIGDKAVAVVGVGVTVIESVCKRRRERLLIRSGKRKAFFILGNEIFIFLLDVVGGYRLSVVYRSFKLFEEHRFHLLSKEIIVIAVALFKRGAKLVKAVL